MSRAVPTKEELSKQLIIGVITALLGIILGMWITSMVDGYRQRKQALPTTQRPPYSQTDWYR